MGVTIGSARHDEHGSCYHGGKAGDQLQRGTGDTVGEVSQQAFYVHAKGWHVLRPKNANHAANLARKMKAACDNAHIGYDQFDRLGIIKAGISTTKDTECDCSTLVRACVIEACGKDPGNFTTADEAAKLEATGLFEPRFSYTSNTVLCTGDVLVTKTKGHTAIVTAGRDRTATTTNKTNSTTKEVLDMAQIGTYRQGSKGQPVKSIQLILNGKRKAGLAVDGDFGAKTKAAVAAWQKAQGLATDGIVGPKTWESLLVR